MDLIGRLSRSPRRALLTVAVLVVVGLPLHAAIKTAGDRGLLPLGQRAPVLQGPTLAGGDFDSTRDAGRLLVYLFLDPTMTSAVQQAEALTSWRERYGDKDDEHTVFVIVFTGGTPERQERFAETFHLDKRDVILDRGGYRQQPFRVTKTPTVYVVDRLGVLRFAAEGVVRRGDRDFNIAVTGYRPQPGSRLTPRKQ